MSDLWQIPMSSTDTDLVPFPMILSTLIMSIIGLFGNITIVIITSVNKNLQSRCNILIGFLALSDALVCLYLVQLRLMMILRMYMLTSSNCYFLSIYGLFALNMQSSLCLIIGFDRLYNVTFPIKYARVPVSVYYSLFGCCFIFSVIITFLGWIDASDNINVPVCLPPTAYTDRSRTIWIGSNFLISIFVIIVYGASQIRCQILRAQHRHEQTMEVINRLLKSLTLVVAIYVSTWFLTLTGLVITQVIKFSPATIGEINQQLGWLVIINASLNFFVYFWRTSEYRKAILRLYGIRRSRSNDVSSVHVHSRAQKTSTRTVTG